MAFAVCNPLIMTAIAIVMVIGASKARELRPSEHGFHYLPAADEKTSPEMKAFFGTSAAAAPKNSTSSNMRLPRAMNSNDTSWWSGAGDGSGGGNRVRHVLMVTSLACGVAGVCLLAASGLIFFVRHRRQRASSLRDDDGGDVSK